MIADCIAAYENQARPFVSAKIFFQVHPNSYSKPALLECDDKKKYWVKFKSAGRSIVAEQIVARLGVLIKAPMARTSLINVSQELINLSPDLSGVSAGFSHGSEFIEGCIDSRETKYCEEEENQIRYARLAVLYGWCEAFDQQYIYEKRHPHRVHSVDHGLFFPGRDTWNIQTLAKASPPAIDPQVTRYCLIKSERIRETLQELGRITNEEICEIVAYPPEDWGINRTERVALAEYLIRRRDSFTA